MKEERLDYQGVEGVDSWAFKPRTGLGAFRYVYLHACHRGFSLGEGLQSVAFAM